MKLLLATLLISFCTNCDLKQMCSEYLGADLGIDVSETDAGNLMAEELLNAYAESDEEGVDVYLSGIDPNTYDGLDVYMADDYTAVMEALQNDENAFYKHTKKATLCVAFDGTMYAVIILSYA